jgi:hypothetical protein
LEDNQTIARSLGNTSKYGKTFCRCTGFRAKAVRANHRAATLITDVHKQKQKQTPWSESASELYRPSDRRLSAK